jgi:dihydrofolate reductase
VTRGPVGMIAAVSPEGAIGLHGKIPWHHPGDLRRFKRVTRGSTVIMGRLTWESMNGRPLPDRRNLVVSRSDVPGVESFTDLGAAIAAAEGPVWLLGGTRIFEEGMRYADLVDITYVPDHVGDPAAVRFPPIDAAVFEPGPLLEHEDEPGLTRRVYTRVAAR